MMIIRARVYNIVNKCSLVLIAVTILLAILTVPPKGFIDFPCWVQYDEQLSCIENPRKIQTCPASMAVYLTTYQAGWSGGGCHFEDSATDMLDIRTPVLNLTLKRDGETVAVNRLSLAPGEGFRHKRVLYWNPWILPTIAMRNFGSVEMCQSACPEHDPPVVLIGYYGTEVSWLKGGVFLTFLGMLFIVTRRQLKSLRQFAQ